MFSADVSFQIFDIESRWLLNEEMRFDASFYAKDVIASRVLIGKLEEKGIQVKRMEDLRGDMHLREMGIHSSCQVKL